jgi:hypothetical protein
VGKKNLINNFCISTIGNEKRSGGGGCRAASPAGRAAEHHHLPGRYRRGSLAGGLETVAGQGVANVYVVEGGVNRWLELYPVPDCVTGRVEAVAADGPAYSFAYATGDSLPSAWPELPSSRSFRFPCQPVPVSGEEQGEFPWPAHAYTKRVKPQVRSVVKGGCG